MTELSRTMRLGSDFVAIHDRQETRIEASERRGETKLPSLLLKVLQPVAQLVEIGSEQLRQLGKRDCALFVSLHR